MLDLGVVEPGQSSTVSLTVAAPASQKDAEIAWDVMRDGWAWFSSHGVPVATTRLGADAANAGSTGNSIVLDGDQAGPTRSQL